MVSFSDIVINNNCNSYTSLKSTFKSNFKAKLGNTLQIMLFPQ